MRSNREMLDFLFEEGLIDLNRGRIFDETPGPMPPDFDFKRVEGMMLGLAVGDALGNTTEGMRPSRRRALYGEIRDYLPNRRAGGRPIGLPSDDTQLAFWTLERMVEDGGLIPENVARIFSERRIFGIGRTVAQFVRNHRSGEVWYRCGVKSAGNGALMRIAPVLIPHLRTGTADLWADAALLAMMTHNDSGSTAACIAFVSILWEALKMGKPPDPLWWAEKYIEVARDLERDEYRPRGGELRGFRGPIWRFVEEVVIPTYEEGRDVLEACEAWWSGAFLLETVPCVLYILMRHADDPEEAIVRAVNDTVDNDTIAAVVGAAVGALHGRDALPKRWIDGLPGRTMEGDDGHIYRLLEEARKAFWEADEAERR